jgi:hypothetical protein
MNEPKSTLMQGNLQPSIPSSEPLLTHGQEQDLEVMLKRMQLNMEKVMQTNPVSSPEVEPGNSVSDDLQPDRMMSILLTIGIIAGTLLVILTEF